MNSFGTKVNKSKNKKNTNSYAFNNAIQVGVQDPNKISSYTSFGSKQNQNPVISGYFIREKSYKEIIISRINTVLCFVLGLLVLVCFVSYYFVVDKELTLRKLGRETIALNLDNSEMQNKLDKLESFSNVDIEVSKSNILQRAKQVIELSAAELPDVNFENNTPNGAINRFLGY